MSPILYQSNLTRHFDFLIWSKVLRVYCVHNAHMFYIKTADIDERTALKAFLARKEILAVFHYIPLHTAPAGKKSGRFHGEDRYITRESERLLRLPMYYGLKDEEVDYVCDVVKAFYAWSSAFPRDV